MRKTLTILWRGALDLIVPPACWNCSAAMVGDEPLCATCVHSLTVDNEPVCPRCSSSLAPAAQAANVCPRCLTENFAFDAAIRLGPYDDARRSAILRAKHTSGEVFAEAVAPSFAKAWKAKLNGERIDGVIPVPLHWRRRWQRGYNQSGILSRSLAKELNVPLLASALRRVKYTPIQSGSREERRSNVRGAFRIGVNPNVRGKQIVLVDDVLTTGATAHEASGVLKKHGAARVIAVVIAHERPRNAT